MVFKTGLTNYVQAPALPNSKRKRGGPVRSPAAVGDATRRAAQRRTAREQAQLQDGDVNGEDEDDQDANPRPPKRGRPRKSEDGAANSSTKTDPRITPRTRRPARGQIAGDEEHEADGSFEGSGSLRRSTRERRSADSQPWWMAGAGDSSVIEVHEETEEEGEEATTTAEPRKRGRRPAQVSASGIQEEPQKKKPPGKKRGGRPSAAASGGTPAEPEVGPKRRGRKRTSDAGEASGWAPRAKPATEAAEETGASGSKVRRRRSRPDATPAAVDLEDEDDMENSQVVPPAKYRQLTSRTRQIPRATISAKWTPLHETSVGAVTALISDSYRPVLLRLQGRELRHQQANNALRAFSSRLHSKLRKGIPFPPPSTKAAARNTKSDTLEADASHVDEFDFERTVNAIQSLESTLNPLLHSVSLLESERDREERALEKDYETLRTLETNARAEVRGWKERGRRAHALAPAIGRGDAAPRGAAEARLEISKSGRKPSAGIFTVRHYPRNGGNKKKPIANVRSQGIEDEEIKSLSRQLGSHVESMRGNLQPIASLLPAITRSRAALQGVLHNHLGPQQYDKAFVD